MDSIDRLHLWIDALNTHVDACHPKLTEQMDVGFQSLERHLLSLASWLMSRGAFSSIPSPLFGMKF